MNSLLPFFPGFSFNLIFRVRILPRILKSKLWELKSILFQKLNKVGRARSKEEIEFLKKDIESNITTLEVPAKKIELSYLLLHIKSAYYFAIQDNKNSLETILELIKLIEKHPNEFNDEPNILISALTNGVYLAVKNEKPDQAQVLFNKLKTLYYQNEDSGSNDLLIKLKSSLWSIELLMVKLTCDFSKFEMLLSSTFLFSSMIRIFI